LGVAVSASAFRAEAQTSVPPPPAAGSTIPTVPNAATGLAGAGALGAAAPQKTIWGFFGLSHQSLAACREKLCRCQLGQLLNSMTTPASAFTGGLIPPLCPPIPSASDLAAMQQMGGAQGAQAVAAKIMQDEADAKARVAAVEYLATVDCRYWPDARQALINALRSDRNECVRYAAARALGSGCCCSKEVIEALRVSVSGEEDKDPAETSPRVRAAAFDALQNCLTRVSEEVTEPEPVPLQRDELGPTPLPETITPLQPDRSTMTNPGNRDHVTVGYVGQDPRPNQAAPAASTARITPRKSFQQTVDQARRTMFEVSRSAPTLRTLPPGKQSVLHALAKARRDVDAASRREAAAQGVPTPPPLPPLQLESETGTETETDIQPIDSAVSPTSFTLPVPVEPAAARGVSRSEAPAAVLPPRSEPRPEPQAQADSPARRGLIGLFKPRSRAGSANP
jgi:hypothetical protein